MLRDNRVRMKIIHDGSHYVGNYAYTVADKQRKIKEKDDFDYLFYIFHEDCLGKKMSYAEKHKYIVDSIAEFTQCWVPDFVKKKLEIEERKIYERKRRFKRKAMLNPWTYFFTVTYNDRLQTEHSFRKRLKKCFSNLHTRRGIKVMGGFQRGDKNDRLHFHGFMYVPDGKMIGDFFERDVFDKKHGTRRKIIDNTFFNATFGNSEFDTINQASVRRGNSAEYICRYIYEEDEKIFYSRGLPEAIYVEIDPDDISATIEYYIDKYVIYDDCIELVDSEFYYHGEAIKRRLLM